MKTIAKLVFKIIGWDIDQTSPEGLKKCVVVMGPHTSNWDFVLGKMAFLSYGVNANYLVKSAAFFFPFGFAFAPCRHLVCASHIFRETQPEHLSYVSATSSTCRTRGRRGLLITRTTCITYRLSSFLSHRYKPSSGGALGSEC